jgi:Tfp pilus assembly protein PilX
MSWRPKALPPRERGAALIIALAFAVLLTGVAVAYLSRATSDRQIAHSSFNQSSADQLAQSAMDNIIGDLRQEILNGSGSPSPTASPVSLFVPTSNANILPMRNPTATPGTTPAIPNLIRRSVRS